MRILNGHAQKLPKNGFAILKFQSKMKIIRIAFGFNEIIPNNKNCDELLKVLGTTFDSSCWEKLKDNTALFKLTWKADFPRSVDGKITYYGKMLNGELF